MSKNGKPADDPNVDRVREILAWVVTDFVDGQATKSERYFYSDEVDGLKSDLAVKVTFEYVEAGHVCDAGKEGTS